MTDTGKPMWFELTAADPDTAQVFYAKVLDWETVVSPNPEHGGYRIAHAGDDAVAGIMPPQGGASRWAGASISPAPISTAMPGGSANWAAPSIWGRWTFPMSAAS